MPWQPLYFTSSPKPSIDTTPISAPPAGIERMAEVNAEIAPHVRELPKQASAAPKDGVDREVSSREPASDGKKVEAKPPEGDPKAREKKENAEAIADLNKFNALELQRMVKSGTIPDSIADNPAAMQALVARIQDFSRMMQMISNMMQVEHETMSAIIRNIKA